jgi:glycosyltransferase involved in cell wall biosynthesis
MRPESTSVALLRALCGYLRWADVVHLTAVYNFPTIPTLLACKILGKPVVWSPRGALQRWKGSTRLRAKAVWERICSLVAPTDTILHVTSEQEARESLEKFPGFKAAIIPNAVEIPSNPVRFPAAGALRLLFLGRLHPKKGIENLLEACHKLKLLPASGFPRDSKAEARGDWSLVIAGTGDPCYIQTLQQHIDRLGLREEVTMAGELVGKEKEEAFGRADLLIAPSYIENFGMVVAEGLAHGLPVIASKGMPWKEIEQMGCGLWVDNDPDTLASSIERISRMPLEAMGLKGRKWMEQEYSWGSAARKMRKLYEESLDCRSEGRQSTSTLLTSASSTQPAATSREP